MAADESADTSPAEIAEPLIESLRRALDAPSLEYGVSPWRLSGGNETDIYGFELRNAADPFDRPLVARVFRGSGTAERARHEAAAHWAVSEQGFAAPRVLLIGDDLSGLGRSFLVMEFVAGCSGVELLRPSAALPCLLVRLPALHAETMVALHRLDAESLLTTFEAAGLDRLSAILDLHEETRERKAARGFPTLEALGVWLDMHRPCGGTKTITHGDLHPLNLMIHRGQVRAVLDWTRAIVAPPEYDLAANRIIVGYGPVVGEGIIRSLVPLMGRWFLWRFEAIYRAQLPVDESLVRYFEVQRALGVLTDVALLRQAMASDAAVPTDRDKAARALDGPNLPKLVAHVERLSGIRVELPPRAHPDPERILGRTRR